MTSSLALQLYSLRRETTVDAEATVRRVPSLGYNGIEMAGTYGWSLDQWKHLLAETDLEIVGVHVGLESLEKEWPWQVELPRALGNRRLIVPSIPVVLRRNAETYREASARLNALGKRARQENLQLLYHNHAFEFEMLGNGEFGIDIMMRETDPQLVAFEIDTHWVERGGPDCLAFIEKHAARIGMIHAKEYRKRDNADVPAGEGDIDFKSLIPLARKNAWPIVVEYEGEDALAAVAASAKYLSAI